MAEFSFQDSTSGCMVARVLPCLTWWRSSSQCVRDDGLDNALDVGALPPAPTSCLQPQDCTYKTPDDASPSKSLHKIQVSRNYVPTYSHESTWPLSPSTVFVFPFIFQDLASCPPLQLIDIGRRRKNNRSSMSAGTGYHLY